MIFIFKQPGLTLIRRNLKYIVVRSIPSLLRSRIVSLATVVVATMSVSDSILRCRKGEWPACRPPLTRGCSDSGFQGVNLGIAARKPSRTAPRLQ